MLYEEQRGWQSQKLCKNSHFQGYQYMLNLDSNGLLQCIRPQWNVNVTKDQWKDWKNLFIIIRFRYQGSFSDILILTFDKQSDEFVRTERVCRKIWPACSCLSLGWPVVTRFRKGTKWTTNWCLYHQFWSIFRY